MKYGVVPRFSICVGLSFCAMWLLLAAFPAAGATFEVTTTEDSGAGSFREAITSVNAQASGSHTISFIGASAIALLTPLPSLTYAGAVTIQGNGSSIYGGQLSSQPEAPGLDIPTDNKTIENLAIISFTGNGITISGNNNVVRGCRIGYAGDIWHANTGHGILIDGGDNNIIGGTSLADLNIISGNGGNGIKIENGSGNQVLNNLIGTDDSGLANIANHYHGIFCNGANTVIGAPGAGNVISGNSLNGIYIFANADGSVVEGNVIGLAGGGMWALPNGEKGIEISNAQNIRIGGSLAGAGNVISGNGGSGVFVNGSYGGIVFQGNKIGCDITGLVRVGNNGFGINISQTPEVTIGGAGVGEGNIISGNENSGISLSQTATTNCVIQRNVIGIAGDGATPMLNAGNGIDIFAGASSNMIGGDIPQEGNHIAHNVLHGVRVDGASTLANTIRMNSIHDNRNSGIMLANGGNGGIAAPVIAGFNWFHGTAPANATVDVYVDEDGEGRIHLFTIVADGAGEFASGIELHNVAGKYLTATATLDGNTSKFSDPAQVPWEEGCTMSVSSAVPLTIPAGNMDSSTVQVTGPSVIGDVNVTIWLDCSYVDGMWIALESAQETEIVLVNAVPEVGSNFVFTEFNDEAWMSINDGAAPFTGCFQPMQVLSGFDGENAAGTWTLKVDNGTSDPAVLQYWEVCITPSDVHTADQDANHQINLSELLRVIQFFNSDGYHCDAAGEDGYAPGPGDESCAPHASDYNPADWDIGLSELLRAIQFFNLGGYHACPGEGTEDGFCPGV